MSGEAMRQARGLDEPVFELVSMRGNMAADMALGLADGVAQWGYVTGDAISPYPKELVLADVTAEIRRNGAVEAQVRSADVLDDQLDSVAWLANALARYDLALEAGHCVMTGSFTRPTAINQGDQWHTQFSSLGRVTASFV